MDKNSLVLHDLKFTIILNLARRDIYLRHHGVPDRQHQTKEWYVDKGGRFCVSVATNTLSDSWCLPNIPLPSSTNSLSSPKLNAISPSQLINSNQNENSRSLGCLEQTLNTCTRNTQNSRLTETHKPNQRWVKRKTYSGWGCLLKLSQERASLQSFQLCGFFPALNL